MQHKVSFGSIRYVKFVRFVVTSFLGQTRIALTLFCFYPCFIRVNPWLKLFIPSELVACSSENLRKKTNFDRFVARKGIQLPPRLPRRPCPI